MSTAIADKNYENPIFVLEFTIFGSGADVRLNDIPALHHDASGKTKSEKPVPEFIIDGINTLTIKSFPTTDDNNEYREGAIIDITLSVRERDGNPSTNNPVLHLRLNPTNKNDELFAGSSQELGETNPRLISHTDTESIVERDISIKSPFPRWAWQDGKNIENTKENYESLLAYYKELWDALNTGDLNSIYMHYDPAAEEFASAYHHDDKKSGHRIMNTGGLINDGDWKLGLISNFLKKFQYKIDIYANGKLAKIIDQKNRSPIVYLGRKAKIINIQKFGFYKNKQNEWVMIR